MNLSPRRSSIQAAFCNVRPEAVIPAIDVDTIYQVPIGYHEEGLDVLFQVIEGGSGQE